MNENEKNLFYRVLKDKISDESTQELPSNIMHIIHKKVQKKQNKKKIFELFGYFMWITIPVIFVGVYLFFYTDFKLPTFHFDFVIPSPNYIIIIFILFVFLVVELFFRKRLYESD